ncbi:MAG: hypothetical protein U0270_07345 [Labilithrix sp.]
MKRLAAATALGAAIAACGLSVTGVAPEGVVGEGGVVGMPQPGPDGTTVVTLPDGNVVTLDGNAPVDSTAPPTDASSDATPVNYPDARPPKPADCSQNNCTTQQQSDQTCAIESCNTSSATRHFPTATNVTMSSVVCSTSTGGAVSAPMKAPAATYSYVFQFVPNETVPDHVTVLMLDFGSNRKISLSREGNDARLCYESGSLGSVCVTKNTSLSGGTTLNVYGTLSTESPVASALFATGNMCSAPLVLDIVDAPFPSTWTARAGCVAGNCSSFDWYDARVELDYPRP